MLNGRFYEKCAEARKYNIEEYRVEPNLTVGYYKSNWDTNAAAWTAYALKGSTFHCRAAM